MKKILILLALTLISTSCFGFNISIKNGISNMPNPARGSSGWKVRLASQKNRWITGWKNLKNYGDIQTFTKQTRGANRNKPLPANIIIQIRTKGKYPVTARATKYFTLRKDVSGISSDKLYVIKTKFGKSGTQEDHYKLVEE